MDALPRQWRAERAQPLARELAGDDQRVGLRHEPVLPQRQRRTVGDGLGQTAAAAQAHARERVAAVAARALRAAGVADADCADEAVLVQVQHDVRAGLAGGGERPPAERRMQVVGVHERSAARQPDGLRDVAWLQSPAQQSGGGAGAGERGGVSREQLGGLVPGAPARARRHLQVRYRALLPAAVAIAVVQEQDDDPIREDDHTDPEPMAPSQPILRASIVIPTRGRPAYLEVALCSIVPQARAVGAEVLVIDDAGASPETREQVRRLGARYEPQERELGLNVARNTGVERSTASWSCLWTMTSKRLGWLAALLTAAREHPDVDVLAGRIRPRLEGRPPRTCGGGIADHDARPRRARRRGAVCVGREHGDPARGIGAGGRVRRDARARRRRAGVAGSPAGVRARRAGAVCGGRRRRSPPDGSGRTAAGTDANGLRARPGSATVRCPARAGAPGGERAQDPGGLRVARRAPALSGGADDGRTQRRTGARSDAGAHRCRRRRGSGGRGSTRRADSRHDCREQWNAHGRGPRCNHGHGQSGQDRSGLPVRAQRDGRRSRHDRA